MAITLSCNYNMQVILYYINLLSLNDLIIKKLNAITDSQLLLSTNKPNIIVGLTNIIL